MSANPTFDEIMEAIRQSGYLMEQTVATSLEELGFHIRTNVAFEDPDEGKSREMDVSAIKRIAVNEEAKISAFVELIVECKNNRNPLVLITRPKNAADSEIALKQFRFPTKYEMRKDMPGGGYMSKEISGYSHLGFDRVHYHKMQASKAVQFCRIDRKGSGWHANHGGLYDAIFYPLAKAVTARIGELPRGSSSPNDWKYLWLLFPIVVTSEDLLTINSTNPDPHPEKQDWVSFSRELKSGKLGGTYALDFVRQESLGKYMQECIGPISDLAKELVEEKSQLLLQALCPWRD